MPVYQVSTKAWYKALKKTGLEGFRLHDLRHTWASWHVQAGTPLNALQELGGRSCAEMVRRYAHLGGESSCELCKQHFREKCTRYWYKIGTVNNR
ncbi:MAG: tyrosine-type recombinase/integrase [Gammaproteobacteria bacterium]|nr:tyrosine-type recombinase/integrase [Gammaproteobacteria bacterium]